MESTFSEEIDRLVRARYTLLYVVTWEEERAMSDLLRLAERRHKALYEWSITNGLRAVYSHNGSADSSRTRDAMQALNEILQKEGPGIFVLKDFHTYLEAPEMLLKRSISVPSCSLQSSIKNKTKKHTLQNPPWKSCRIVGCASAHAYS